MVKYFESQMVSNDMFYDRDNIDQNGDDDSLTEDYEDFDDDDEEDDDDFDDDFDDDDDDDDDDDWDGPDIDRV